MELKPVESSNIAAVGYDGSTQTLIIRFHNGAEYSYNPVTEEAKNNLLAAESIGAYFNKHIRTNKGINFKRLDK